MKKYIVCGWVDCETCVEIGTWESRHAVHEVYDLLMQIFDDGNYKEGLFIRPVK